MAYTPPFDRRKLKKDGVIDDEKFFHELAAECNYHDVQGVKDVYMGFVRVLTRQLKKNKVARAPHLGDFALLDRSTKSGLVASGVRGEIKSFTVLKFYPQESWKKYFKIQSEMNKEQ